MSKQKKRWYDYLWIASLTYLVLGFFNILFAWLGLICFLVPLTISIANGTKGYCNRYCGRGQLFGILGGRFGLSRKKDIPRWMNWAYHGTLFHPGVAQFAFGFYSVMLTSTVLGLITMVLYKPRSWCVYCPMGTMTQLICKVKDKKDG